jgi:adenine phosphoribosyltransferase
MTEESIARLNAAIRDVPDFPKPGILFKDITPILGDGELFSLSIDALTEVAGDAKIDKVVGIDARGFIFGAAVAHKIGAGFVPIRKKGKLPWNTECVSYKLEYGESEVEIHKDAVLAGESVLVVDDLLATGGTAEAAVELLEKLGANIVGVAFLIELEFLKGREKLGNAPVTAILKY